MKITRLLIAAASCAAILASCTRESEIDPANDPFIKLSDCNMVFSADAGEIKSIQMYTNREWIIRGTENYDWLTVTPITGQKPADSLKITVAADANAGENRTAALVFTTGSASTTLTVTQSGGSKTVYFNNFDKEVATQTSSKWPYVYDTNCWMNETGSGVSSISYITSGNKATVRNNSNSTGSGVNNIFFGSDARFCVKNITLDNTKTDYTLSFYGIRNVYDAKEGESVFDHNVFKLYISDNGGKWVSVDYAFPDGTDPDGAWGCATSSFTVPAGTSTLCIGVPTLSETSTYRIDDVKLVESIVAGTAVDFTKGIEIAEFAGGDTPSTDPTKAEAKTVKEFIELAKTDTYYKLTGTVSGFNATYCSFNLTDATGSIYVYSVTEDSKTKYASVIKNGGTVTLSGKYSYYASKSQDEVVDAVIIEYKSGEDPDPGVAEGDGSKENPFNATAAIAKAVEVGETASTEFYYIKGFIKSIKEVSTSFGNASFYITDKKDGNTSEFYCFQVKYIGGAAFTSADQIKTGDEVVVYAQVVNYKGNTPETNGKGTGNIVSINGKTGDEPFFGVAPLSISVPAEASTKSITVSANVAWTASCDNQEFSIDVTSGTGNGTITVNCPENKQTSARTANVTVSTTDSGIATKSYTVVITQLGGEDPEAVFVELTNAEIVKSLTDLGSTSSTYTSVTYKGAGGDWTSNSSPNKSNKWIQIRDTKGSYLKSPVFASEIEKIEIRTDANKAVKIRKFYAVPSDTQLPTGNTTSYSSADYNYVLANAYGSASSEGLASAGTAGEVGEKVTVPVSGSTKDFILLVTAEGSGSATGASYVNSIKVYLKK